MPWYELLFMVFAALVAFGFYIGIFVLARYLVEQARPDGWQPRPKPPERTEAEEEPPVQSPEELDRAIAALTIRIGELERTGGSGTTMAQAALHRHRARLAELQRLRQLQASAMQPWSPGNSGSEGIRQPPGQIQPREPQGG